MTPFECWKLTREALNLVLNVKIIEAYDKRPGKDRPNEPYASLSLKKISPLSAPYKVEDKSSDEITATIITPSEIEFELTIHHSPYAMDLSFLTNALSFNESVRRLFIENEMSAWGTKVIERDPQKVNESYEDQNNITLIIAAPLYQSDSYGFADNVEASVSVEGDVDLPVITEYEQSNEGL